MDDNSALIRLHLEQEEEEEEGIATLMSPISNSNTSSWSAYPTHLPSSSTFAMDYTDNPPLLSDANLSPYINQIHNFSAFSHFAAPVPNTHHQLPLHYNNDTATPRMACSRASTSAVNCDAVEKIAELLHTGQQMDGTFPQLDCHHGDQSIGHFASMSTCFSPWVAPKHGSIMMIAATPTKGQLLLKKLLFKLLPWMRDVNSLAKHRAGADINQSSHAGTSNPDNYEAMAYNNDAMLMEDNGRNTNINMVARQHLLAERNRRKKQSESLRVLQALLPGKPKKDKVSILRCAIEHIKKLKDSNDDLEKHIKEIESTTLAPRSRWVSGSSSIGKSMREKGGYMSSNINSSPIMVPPSPDMIMTSSHHPHSEHDLRPQTSSSSMASVSINTTLQSDHTLSMHVLALARSTFGSNKLLKVLTCLKDLGFEALSIQSTFEGDTFMAEISTRANQGSSLNEAQIKDSLVNALLSTDFLNELIL